MLTEPKIRALVPTTNPALSKEFYLNTLGLHLVSEDNYALEFESDCAALRVTIVDTFVPHPFAILSFRITKIYSQVEALNKLGVKFERYDSLDQDELGIWVSPSGARIAWFKDPDGNLLSLTEYAS